MFVPSFFTGHLINRFGVQRIILSGVALMLVCIGINFSGTTVEHFWIALLALGVGWNFMFIGGTSLLSETYRVEESAKAQAFNDFIVFSVAAISSFSAGALLHWLSWERVNSAAIPVLGLALLIQFWLWMNRQATVKPD
jgi:MFS family permease